MSGLSQAKKLQGAYHFPMIEIYKIGKTEQQKRQGKELNNKGVTLEALTWARRINGILLLALSGGTAGFFHEGLHTMSPALEIGTSMLLGSAFFLTRVLTNSQNISAMKTYQKSLASSPQSPQ